jgi:hypothetical protein
MAEFIVFDFSSFLFLKKSLKVVIPNVNRDVRSVEKHYTRFTNWNKMDYRRIKHPWYELIVSFAIEYIFTCAKLLFLWMCQNAIVWMVLSIQVCGSKEGFRLHGDRLYALLLALMK